VRQLSYHVLRHLAISIFAAVSAVLSAWLVGTIGSIGNPKTEPFAALFGILLIGGIFAFPFALVGTTVLLALSLEHSTFAKRSVWTCVGGIMSLLFVLYTEQWAWHFVSAMVVAGLIGGYAGHSALTFFRQKAEASISANGNL
jgi:hypothetical protein